MKQVEFLHPFEQKFWQTPDTLTQPGQTVKQSPPWVRHHILVLEVDQYEQLLFYSDADVGL